MPARTENGETNVKGTRPPMFGGRQPSTLHSGGAKALPPGNRPDIAAGFLFVWVGFPCAPEGCAGNIAGQASGDEVAIPAS
jgi:hypothetical protein